MSTKESAGKLRWSLLPWSAVEWVVRVMEYGARKYTEHGWKTVNRGKELYQEALLRHVVAYSRGEYLDPESGLPHLAHIGANVTILLELDPPTSRGCTSPAEPAPGALPRP